MADSVSASDIVSQRGHATTKMNAKTIFIHNSLMLKKMSERERKFLLQSLAYCVGNTTQTTYWYMRFYRKA